MLAHMGFRGWRMESDQESPPLPSPNPSQTCPRSEAQMLPRGRLRMIQTLSGVSVWGESGREWESCGAGLRAFSALRRGEHGWEGGPRRVCGDPARTPGFSLPERPTQEGAKPGELWPWSGGLQPPRVCTSLRKAGGGSQASSASPPADSAWAWRAQRSGTQEARLLAFSSSSQTCPFSDLLSSTLPWQGTSLTPDGLGDPSCLVFFTVLSILLILPPDEPHCP